MKAWIKRHFWPDAYVPSPAEIDWAKLYARDYRLLLCDLDNTLQTHGRSEPESSAIHEIRRVKAAGFRVALVTNAKQPRAARLERGFAEIGEALRVYGAARKPSPDSLLRACREMAVPPERSLMLGDQLFTDIRAGKRAGLATILVRPRDRHEPWYIWLKRQAERVLLAAWEREENRLV